MTDPEMSIVLQCELLDVARATYYAGQHLPESNIEELRLLALIDEEYTRRPFYGSRKMVPYLLTQGVSRDGKARVNGEARLLV